MQRRLNKPAANWQQAAITWAVVIGLLAGTGSIVLAAALLQRTCTVYDLTAQECRR